MIQARSVSVVIAIIILIFAIGIFLNTCMSTISLDKMSAEVRTAGAVVVQDATFVRDDPRSRAIFPSNTLKLKNPTIIKDLLDLQTTEIIVVAKEARFVGDVAVAIQTTKSIGRGSNAVLPVSVDIYRVETNGKITKIDSGTINYIEVD